MKLAGRAPAGALVFGILALVGFPFSFPVVGFENHRFRAVVAFAGLGLLLGDRVGRPSAKGRRWVAIAGILCSVVSPFTGRAFWPEVTPGNESGTIGDIRTCECRSPTPSSMSSFAYVAIPVVCR